MQVQIFSQELGVSEGELKLMQMQEAVNEALDQNEQAEVSVQWLQTGAGAGGVSINEFTSRTFLTAIVTTRK